MKAFENITKQDLLIMAFIFVMGALYLIKNHKTKQPIKPIKAVVIKLDTIAKHDSIIMAELVPILKKREGFSPKPYSKSGKIYTGYGHLLLKTDKSIHIITEIQADSILHDDICKAYIEVKRIEKRDLKKNIYQVFIRGKELK